MLRLFALAVVCALLPWHTCAEEPMELKEHICLETVELKLVHSEKDLKLEACKERCQSEQWKERCDTVELAGNSCNLYECKGECHQDDGCSHTVYMKPTAMLQQQGNQVQALMLSPLNTAEERKDEDEQKNDDDQQKSNNPVCAMPRVVGMCKAAFRKFYYDSETKSCQQFIYGGCGGNGNNFDDQKSCERTCMEGEKEEVETPNVMQTLKSPKKTELTADDFQEQCNAARVVGPCRAAFPRWFYNSTAKQCQRFIYGGCGGNKNNYETQDHCNSNCAAVNVLPSKKKLELSEEDKAHCSLAPESGPCRAAFTMFYFDMDSQTCKTFLYGGCRGNDNRYTSENECQERCGNLGAEGRGQARNRWTAAFFLFLTLAAVSFLLLTTLIVITMRRNRQPPRRALSIRSDKEELLPDSDSLDSLPLPESPNKA